MLKICIWAPPEQGKSAYLYALGYQLHNRKIDEFSFSPRIFLPSGGLATDTLDTRNHYEKLRQKIRGGWANTQLKDGKIEGHDLDLFTAHRFHRFHVGRAKKMLLRSSDLPGEAVDQVLRRKSFDIEQKTRESIENDIGDARACFIIVRADILANRDGLDSRSRDLADVIQSSIGFLEPDGTKSKRHTAILLTACDALSKEDRERIRFDEDQLYPEERRKAAREFLLERAPHLRGTLEQHPHVEVFAISSTMCAAVRKADGTTGFANEDPQPRFAEEPVLWVLAQEFGAIDREARERRNRNLLLLAATSSALIALASQVASAPLARVTKTLDTPADLFWPRITDLPSWALALDSTRAKPALYAEAVDAARSKRDAHLRDTLRVLDALDPRGHHASRAHLEVARIRYDGWETLNRGLKPELPVSRLGAAGEFRRGELELRRPLVDRYGEAVLQLEYLRMEARSAAVPGDAPSQRVLAALGNERILTVQHGREIGRALADGWTKSDFSDPARFVAVLAGLDELEKVVPGEDFIAIAVSAVPRICDAALLAATNGEAKPLGSLSGWRNSSRVLRDAITSQVVESHRALLASQGDVERARGAIASVLAQSADLLGAFPSLHLETVDALVALRDEAGLVRIRATPFRSSEATVRSEAALAAADWALLEAIGKQDPTPALDALHDAYAVELQAAGAEAAFRALQRFFFVGEVFLKRQAGAERQFSRRAASLTANCLMRSGFLDKLESTKARWVANRLASNLGPDQGPLAEQVALSVAGRAKTFTPETAAVVVDELAGCIRSSGSTREDKDRILHELANVLVQHVLSEQVEYSSQSLVQVVSYWHVVGSTSPDRARLEGLAVNIANRLVRSGEWDSRASESLARLVVGRERPAELVERLEDPSVVRDRLVADAESSLARGEPELTAMLLHATYKIAPTDFRDPRVMGRFFSPSGGLLAAVNDDRFLPTLVAELKPDPGVTQGLLGLLAESLTRLLQDRSEISLDPDTSKRVERLSRMVGADPAVRKGLSASTRSRLQSHDAARLIAYLEAGQIVEARNRLDSAVGWGTVDPDLFKEAAVRSKAALDVVLGALVDLESDPDGNGPAGDAVSMLIRAFLVRGGDTGDPLVFLGALMRCLQRGVPDMIPSRPLAELLAAQCVARAAAGDLVGLSEAWRATGACTAARWIPFDDVQIVGRPVVDALSASSLAANPRGWGIEGFEKAVLVLVSLPKAQVKSVDGFLLALANKVAALAMSNPDASMGREGSAQPGAEAKTRIQFAMALMCKMVDVDWSGRTDVDRAPIMQRLAQVVSQQLLREESQPWLMPMLDVLPSRLDSSFQRELATALREGGQSLVTPRMVVSVLRLASSGNDRVRVLFSPALEQLLLRDCPLDSETLASSIDAVVSGGGWPDTVQSRLAAWVVSLANRSFQKIGVPGQEVRSFTELGTLVSAYTQLCERLKIRDQAERVLDQIAAPLAAKLSEIGARPPGEGRNILSVASEALSSAPRLRAEVNRVRAELAILAEDLALAIEQIAGIADRQVADAMGLFVQRVERMRMVTSRSGSKAFLSKQEVSEGEYRRFVEAMTADPALLESLARKVEFPPGSDRRQLLDAIRPGNAFTNDELPVHKISWWGARLYVEWVGHELPTLEFMEAAWGNRAYPWGDTWNSELANTKERYSDKEPTLLTVDSDKGQTLGGILNLHGNVTEFVASAPRAVEVRRVGGHAWSEGQDLCNAKGKKIYTESTRVDARSVKSAGSGLRTMLRIPKEWKR